MISTTQLIAQFADLIKTYLHLNDAYRRAGIRNPIRRQEIKTLRNTAYKATQNANATLHTHLSLIAEPDQLMQHARELIRLWDARNTCFEQLTNNINKEWHERPVDVIARLNKAERHLKDQLETVKSILKTQSTN